MGIKPQKHDLLAKVADAFRLSGWQLLWLNNDHPARVLLIKSDEAIDAWVHVWSLTSGGRLSSMPNERRIQPTGINKKFYASSDAQTLIFGWSDEVGVFAAFDYNYHSERMGKSSSVQTDLPALRDAARDGIGVFSKGTGELSIAVRPDMMGFYVEQMHVLHKLGKSAAQLSVLRKMASDPLQIAPGDIPGSRRKVMTTTLRLLRERRFSEHVLEAYEHRCAFCEVQLRLLDAAHILPVKHPESTDGVSNGVALCALHHRAYDAALIMFDANYEIQINEVAINRLEVDGRSGGVQRFTETLRSSLLIPKISSSQPSIQMIAKANVLRGWPTREFNSKISKLASD